VFGDEDCSARNFTAQRQALHQSAKQQEDRREHADLSVSGQKADQYGRYSHQENGEGKYTFASNHVAEHGNENSP
jgi:hypothetical protein